MKHFCCERVSKSYQGIPTIQDIGLELGKEEMVSLLGISGVGKTTLFNILSGVDTPDEGRVLLDGEEITGQAGRVSYMLQKDLLLPYKTIVDNVSLPLRLRGIGRKQAREEAQTHFNQFGLSGFENSYPSQLSGGMRQRAALLRTYLQSGDIILLDEPFSALDALTKLDMHRWYLNIIRRIGASTLFITHDIDEALLLSDRVYILSGNPGRITRELHIQAPRPRSSGFLTTELFLQYKQQVLGELGLSEK